MMFHAGPREAAGPTAVSAPPASASLCLNCRVHRSCIGSIAAEAGTTHLQGVLSGRQALQSGEVLRRDTSDRAFFVVRSGCLKSVQAQTDGARVLGFHLPGDLLAADAPQVTFTAVVATELCAMRYPPGAGVDADTRALLGRLWDMRSCELLREHAQRSWFATLAAHQRVAAFLSTIASRLRARGESTADFRLRFSIGDIAGYLRLPSEPVGETLASFVRRGLLQGGPGQLRVVDAPALQREAHMRRPL
ncbi:MAG TPA: helix-turn-helix domain-containing protein [Ramlibacter sp.]|uniref:Crp/Fnr family transcriptional regulator n=1 Tax=Ramlibacter sp. TaxID=1917967 RepID=UPI002ED2FB99